MTQLVRLAMVLALISVPARAQTVEEFYHRHELVFYVGYPVGAAYDLYARLVGRHLGAHIPGNPTVVMRNMPGASSLILANALGNTLPRDGSVIGALFERIGLEPLVNPQNAKYDGRQFGWIGSVLKVTDVCMFWADAPAKTIADAMTREVIVGTAGNSGGSALEARVLNAFTGTKFRLIAGYGGPELFIAMERGETQARCGMSWGGLKASKPDWLAQGKLNIVVQLGLRKHPELPEVPLVMDLVKSPEDRIALEYLYATQEMGRPFAAPPGTPPERVAALRRAFDETVGDPDFLRDASRSNLEVAPITGAAVQEIVDRLYGTPREIIDRVEALRGPADSN